MLTSKLKTSRITAWQMQSNNHNIQWLQLVTKSAYRIHSFIHTVELPRYTYYMRTNIDCKNDGDRIVCRHLIFVLSCSNNKIVSIFVARMGEDKYNKMHKIAYYHVLKSVMLSLFPSIDHFRWISSPHFIYVAQFDSPSRSRFRVAHGRNMETTFEYFLYSIRCIEFLSIPVHSVAKRK